MKHHMKEAFILALRFQMVVLDGLRLFMQILLIQDLQRFILGMMTKMNNMLQVP